MAMLKSIPLLAIALQLSLCVAAHAQNPPMNCTPDGIIEVCTLADSTSAASAPVAVVPPAPKITYEKGLLAISAENVPLNEVLQQISAKTGAKIEIPVGSGNEPVFAHIGPGPVRDVLVSLLNGSPFNYVIAGSPNKTNNLESVVLTPAGQSAEAEMSSDVSVPSQGLLASVPRKPVTPTGAPQTPEEQRAAFMAEVESQRGAVMQRVQEKFAEMSAKGLIRTPDPNAPDSPADSPSQ
jgi:hypothetical protein